MIQIAALLTFHNRKEKTLSAIEALYQRIVLPPGTQIAVYVVDDGSTDGTSAAIAERFPQVKLLQGNGHLFWNGGMRVAFAEAIKEGFNYYLWLNDDTTLLPDAVSRLLQTSAKFNDKAIIVGSTQDPDTGQLTYGGVKRLHPWRPLKFTSIAPQETDIEVDTMNGNCALVPQTIAEKVGNLDPAFTHGRGDFDYGLRASRLNFNVIVVQGYIGTCKRNDLRGSWRDQSLPFFTRLRKTLEPNGFPPHETAVFAKRYGGFFWPIYWALAYRHLLIP